jgi:HAD domain in Swiss Army Knife RNA repair proteins
MTPMHQSEPRVYVFLDFDGVMRRLSSQPFKFDVDCRERFESVLREYPHARVVIASIWRLGLSLDALRKMFSPDIAPRIVGVTPEAPGLVKHYRLREVLGYLRRHGASEAPWVIIDDNRAQYPEGVKVIPTEPQKGFDARAAAALSMELQMPQGLAAAAAGFSARL